MPAPDSQRTMNQKIFEIGLSTEAVSLYLLCCHLEDTMVPVSLKNIKGLWNGDEESLNEAIHVLLSRQVLARSLSPADGTTVYWLNGPEDWKS